jgi:hypothetical protein
VSAPVPVTPTPPVAPGPTALLQEYLRSHAGAGFALPGSDAAAPSLRWSGPLSYSAAATALPGGRVIPVTDALVRRPAANRWAATLPGNPQVNGLPCYRVDRSYSCKGQARDTGSVTTLRINTDAPLIEITGVVADGSWSNQTLIVDGQLVPAQTLSAGLGGGGWLNATLQIDFGSRATRDIWIETGIYPAYVSVSQSDVVTAIDDSAEPQITVIGDSYQLSRSATFANGGSIALELASRLGIRRVAVDGIGGTGYWNSGGNFGNLNDRLTTDAADSSSIYLVIAGINDYGDVLDPPQLVWPTRAVYEQSVLGYYSALRAAQPNAVIVATAPFCPVPPMSDSDYVANAGTNSSGLGDYLYKAELQKRAVQSVGGPWVYIDVLMGGGWLNSSGASGDVTGLQWFTGGTAGPGTTASFKPGNTQGGGGGGFGGVASIPVLSPGQYLQAPDIYATGGSGSGLLLASSINNAGALQSLSVVTPGSGYTSAAGLPVIQIDPTYQVTAATLGPPQLLIGTNPGGQYPLAAFAPPGATDLNNIYTYLMPDLTHPSPLGVNYLSTRLAENIYEAVLAL